MRLRLRRTAGLLCLALLTAVPPTALTPTARAARSAARAHVHAVPTGLRLGSAAVAAAGGTPLGWSTYLGGSRDDQGRAIASDQQGNVYVTGVTESTDFPITPGAAQRTFSGVRTAFVAAYDAHGRVRWATYLGGSGNDDGRGIATDGQGNVYVTGTTNSRDFPVTPGAAQSHIADGALNAFVASYTVSGHLRWATYLGGSAGDAGTGIAVDRQGNVYVTGTTYSRDFPVTAGAAQTKIGGPGTAFVAAYDARGHLRWATYLGGSGTVDQGVGIAADERGNVYVTGNTNSLDFPVTPGAAQRTYGGGLGDAFLAAYAGSGRLRWVTYLGGSALDEGYAIATDRQGNVYATGTTTSNDFPINSGATQPSFGVNFNAFVAAYDAGGKLLWATYLAGSVGDGGGMGIATDKQGSIYVTGNTNSSDFPVTPGAAQTIVNGVINAFVASYTASGHLRWATYLGGSLYDEGYAIVTDKRGNVYVTGNTNSRDFPITPGAAQTIFGGGEGDAFVARLVVPNTGGGDALVAPLVVPSSGPAALAPASPPPPGTPHARYFPSTSHTLRDPFLSFWDRLAGIPTLGLPLSEPFNLGGQEVQVTERAVLVYSAGQVQLLPLGRLLSAARPLTPVAPVSNTATRLYFPSTGHTLTGPFLDYWRSHQGTVLLGAPIGEPEQEGLVDRTGRSYLVQWFVNGRLELHPAARGQLQVLQGRVGYEYLHRLGLL